MTVFVVVAAAVVVIDVIVAGGKSRRVISEVRHSFVSVFRRMPSYRRGAEHAHPVLNPMGHRHGR